MAAAENATQRSEKVAASPSGERTTTMAVGLATPSCQAKLAQDPYHPSLAGPTCTYTMSLRVGKPSLISNVQAQTILRAAARSGHPYHVDIQHPRLHAEARSNGYYSNGWWYGYAEVLSCGSSSCPSIDSWHVAIQYNYIASNDSRFQVWLQGSVACYNNYGGSGGWTVNPDSPWCGVYNNGTQVLSGGDDFQATCTNPLNGTSCGQIGSYQRADVGAVNGSPPVTWMEGPYAVSCHDDFYGNCTTG